MRVCEISEDLVDMILLYLKTQVHIETTTELLIKKLEEIKGAKP